MFSPESRGVDLRVEDRTWYLLVGSEQLYCASVGLVFHFIFIILFTDIIIFFTIFQLLTCFCLNLKVFLLILFPASPEEDGRGREECEYVSPRCISCQLGLKHGNPKSKEAIYYTYLFLLLPKR